MRAISTPRLTLIPATLAHMNAELESLTELGSLLGAHIPGGWPPGDYDLDAIHYLRDRLLEHPNWVGWLCYYVLYQDERQRTVVGAAGYFGPPDEKGEVEIGYSIVPHYEGRGFASEALTGLVQHALPTPGLSNIVAHTVPDNLASIRVLNKGYFEEVGPGLESGTIRFEYRPPN